MFAPDFDALSMTNINIDRIRQIESKFGDESPPLMLRGRVLLADGVLIKICSRGQKRRQFFLFNDLLVYGSPAGGDNFRRLVKQRVLDLKCVAANRVESEPRSFEIISKKKSFRVRANTEQEAAKWVDGIKRCVARCSGGSVAAPAPNSLTSGQLLQGALDRELTPMWIPDDTHVACMICGDKFTLVNRKHHCRKCGILVCATCSNQRLVLPSQGKKPHRICLNCYRLIKTGAQMGAPVRLDTAAAPGAGNATAASSAGCSQRHRLAPSSSESGSDVFNLDEPQDTKPQQIRRRDFQLRRRSGQILHQRDTIDDFLDRDQSVKDDWSYGNPESLGFSFASG